MLNESETELKTEEMDVLRTRARITIYSDFPLANNLQRNERKIKLNKRREKKGYSKGKGKKRSRYLSLIHRRARWRTFAIFKLFCMGIWGDMNTSN